MSLDNLKGSNEADILKRIKAARSEQHEPTEPQLDTPDEAEVVDETIEEVSEVESDEFEDANETTLELDEAEDFVVELDGREIPLSEIKEWEKGNLRQSDYTRKTQELAEQRKQIEKRAESLETKESLLDDYIDRLGVMVEGFDKQDFDGYTLDELRQADPGEYLRVTEEQKARREALEKAKQSRTLTVQERTQEKAQGEILKLAERNKWLDNGKETEQYKRDIKTVTNYLDSLGMSPEEQQGILVSGHGQVYLDAAKAYARKDAPIAKKARRAPMKAKSGGTSKSSAQVAVDKAEKAFKSKPTPENAHFLRKARARLKA